MRFSLNSGVARKHFLLKHQLDLEAYMIQFRGNLLKEKAARPVMPSTHTLGRRSTQLKHQEALNNFFG